MAEKLGILVLSDLHAHSGDPRSSSSPSHYSTNSIYSQPEMNPLSGIAAIIRGASLKVDWVLCPGDMGDKADAAAQAAAWKALAELSLELGAKHLIGTAGNHDVDSRRFNADFDPKSSLQSLTPLFPIEKSCFESGDRVYADRYWSRNYVIVPFEEHECTLAIINSSAFHGYSSDATGSPSEHLRGKISPLTLNALRGDLTANLSKINIALVHHHLRKHPNISDAESYMVNGELLVECFKSTGRQWLVIHGHQHVPLLTYAASHFYSPTILSSGSVSAKTFPALGKHPRNQMHHIEIDPNQIGAPGAEIRGMATTWTWSDIVGWSPATPDAGIPYKAGFGFRPELPVLSKEIMSHIAVKSKSMILKRDLLTWKPDIGCLIPEDLDVLCHLLRQEGLVVERDNYGHISYLEKPSG